MSDRACGNASSQTAAGDVYHKIFSLQVSCEQDNAIAAAAAADMIPFLILCGQY